MLTIYRTIYFLLSNFIQLIAPVLPEHLVKWIKLKDQNDPILETSAFSKRILFHAASGEIEYVKSIIRQLKLKSPDTLIFVSYSSPSAEKLFLNIKDSVTQFIPLPWDTPHQTKLFLNKLNPELIVFSRTDFWPEFISQAQQKNIPLIAVSVYTQFGFLQNLWLKFVLSKFKYISAVSETVSDQLRELLPTSVQIEYLSDTRFDQVLHRLSQPSRFEIQSKNKVIVFGSTWHEDEVVLMKCVPELLGLGYKIVWCPHDISKKRITDLKTQLAAFSLDLFSNQQSPYTFEKKILILDQVGYLADIYRYSQIAFVGGSFKAKVHSVMEPLCAGNSVLVGPYFKNNPEAVDFLKTDIVQSVQTPRDFMTAVITNQNRFQKSDISELAKSKSGATEKTVQVILSLLNMTS
jgi:3-deoxy-D-manno-octulosonic-acid transferase